MKSDHCECGRAKWQIGKYVFCPDCEPEYLSKIPFTGGPEAWVPHKVAPSGAFIPSKKTKAAFAALLGAVDEVYRRSA